MVTQNLSSLQRTSASQVTPDSTLAGENRKKIDHDEIPSTQRLQKKQQQQVRQHQPRRQQEAQVEEATIGHLLTILPWTDGEMNPVEDFLLSLDVASYLAVRDFNRRNSRFLGDITILDGGANNNQGEHSDEENAQHGITKSQEEYFRDCTFLFTLDMRNSHLDPLASVKQLQEALGFYNTDNNTTTTRPTVILGAYSSSQTTVLAELAGIYGLPIVSPSATAQSLENLAQYPTFARTVPTNLGGSRAICIYYSSLQVDSFAVFATRDPYGISFVQNLQQVAVEFKMQVRPVFFDVAGINTNKRFEGSDMNDANNTHEETARVRINIGYQNTHEKTTTTKSDTDRTNRMTDPTEQSFEELRRVANETNYFFGVMSEGWRAVVVELYRRGFLGGQKRTSWVFAEVTTELVGVELPPAQGDHSTEEEMKEFEFQRDLRLALNGTGSLLLRSPPDALEKMNEEWEALVNNAEEWQDYISKHVGGPFIFEADVTEDRDKVLENLKGASQLSLLAYDAVMTLGLGACRVLSDSLDVDLSAPADLSAFAGIDNLVFDGASGRVAFDPLTRSRSLEQIEYQILNIRVDEHGDGDNGLTLLGPESFIIQVFPGSIQEQDEAPFWYPDGTTIPPDTLRVVQNLNLVSPPLLICCYTLCAVSMMISIVAGIWTYVNRNKQVVRESQPIFLGLLCIGAFFMATTIVPLGFQEPIKQGLLDAGCMAVPWLLTGGFTLAYAALFSKIYRINQVFKSAQAFQRIKISPYDVLKPLLLLMALNVTVLTVWTIVTPIRWIRTIILEDEFGRPLESFGSCLIDDPLGWGLLALTACINGSALLIANYQSYQARNLPSRWNESFYVGLTNFVILETGIISLPVFVLVQREPDSFLLVSALANFVLVMAVMLPAFLPKILMNNNTGEKPKVLRLNKNVSAYPTNANPHGLFSGLSFRLPPNGNASASSGGSSSLGAGGGGGSVGSGGGMSAGAGSAGSGPEGGNGLLGGPGGGAYVMGAGLGLGDLSPIQEGTGEESEFARGSRWLPASQGTQGTSRSTVVDDINLQGGGVRHGAMSDDDDDDYVEGDEDGRAESDKDDKGYNGGDGNSIVDCGQPIMEAEEVVEFEAT